MNFGKINFGSLLESVLDKKQQNDSYIVGSVINNFGILDTKKLPQYFSKFGKISLDPFLALKRTKGTYAFQNLPI